MLDPRALQKQAVIATMRATHGVLDRIAPAVGGRLATWQFFRLPPCPPLEQRQRDLPLGSPAYATVDGRTVRGHVWGPDDAPTVYLVHGWGGWWQHLGSYVKPLVGAGFRVIAFDGLSHGESDAGAYGPRAGAMPELSASLRGMVDAHGPAHAIVAHSGGAMATLHALDHGLDARRLVLVAPSASVADMVTFLRRMLGIGARSAEVMIQRASARANVEMDDFTATSILDRLAAAGRLPEGLLVHDEDDDETFAASTHEMARHWPGVLEHYTVGLGHRRVLWQPGTVQRAAAFIAR